jgi:hypothetical protein
LVLVAPTIGTHDYSAFRELLNPVLVLASETDFAVRSEQLNVWFDRLTGPKHLLRGQWDDHFFRGHEAWLADAIFEFIQDQWSSGT